MNIDYINPLLGAIVEVLSVMANIQPTAGKAILISDARLQGS
jgi:CheY-specific phosphatase CheX